MHGDAPHHAALALLRRQHGGQRAFDPLGTEDSAGKAPMAAATRSVGTAWASRSTRSSLQATLGPQGLERSKTLGSPAFVAPVTHAEISLARWRAWVDETAAMAELDHDILFPLPTTTLFWLIHRRQRGRRPPLSLNVCGAPLTCIQRPQAPSSTPLRRARRCRQVYTMEPHRTRQQHPRPLPFGGSTAPYSDLSSPGVPHQCHTQRAIDECHGTFRGAR